ncbi:MAG TPA: hypothetical protein VLI92_03125 [Candidatus Saccharimonadales bacterium]|nr:hypothetical protein [Candidatus Saccharimonadales bacterium]
MATSQRTQQYFFRLYHLLHTRNEKQPPEKLITVSPEAVQGKLLKMEFRGIAGLVKHSAHPIDPTAVGDLKGFQQDYYSFWYPRYRFKALRSLECNLSQDGGSFGIDGIDQYQDFDIIIASIHCVKERGWTGEPPASEFVLAYQAIIPELLSLRHEGKLVALGHMMYYAHGDNWADCYQEVLLDCVQNDITVGVFLDNKLRRNSQWTEPMLYSSDGGLPVLQEWALKFIRAHPNVKFTLDPDMHEDADSAWMTLPNWDLLKLVLYREGIYLNFCDVVNG